MELGEFISQYNSKLSDISDNVQRHLYASLLDAKALIQQRINTKGEAFDGRNMSTYFVGHRYEGGYTKAYYRRKKKLGRYRGVVDLQLSGRMWNNIKIVEERREDTRFYALLSGQGEDMELQMEGLAIDRGDFLTLSESEERFILENLEQKVNQEIQNLFT